MIKEILINLQVLEIQKSFSQSYRVWIKIKEQTE